MGNELKTRRLEAETEIKRLEENLEIGQVCRCDCRPRYMLTRRRLLLKSANETILSPWVLFMQWACERASSKDSETDETGRRMFGEASWIHLMNLFQGMTVKGKYLETMALAVLPISRAYNGLSWSLETSRCQPLFSRASTAVRGCRSWSSMHPIDWSVRTFCMLYITLSVVGDTCFHVRIITIQTPLGLFHVHHWI